MQGRVRQVIVDESFSAFVSEDAPASLAPLVADLPHLVVVNYLRVAARSETENRRILAALRDVLAEPVAQPLAG